MNCKILAAVTAALALAACGQQQKAETNANAPGATQLAEPSRVYNGTGKVSVVAGDQVSIAHGPIQSIGWPAMTMTFAAPPDIAARANVGSDVDFAFRKQGSTYVLTTLQKR